MSGKDESRQKSFINEIGQGTVSFTDQEFAMLKRYVEIRGRDAAHVTVAPVDTAQYCGLRSPSPETSLNARVYIEENEEGSMDPERDQLESPSASTGFKTPGQQCHSNWEIGRTTAAGCLTAGVGSNFGINTSSPTERVIGTRDGSVTTTPPIDSSKTAFLQTRRKPKDPKTGSEESKQFDPGGKVGEPPPWKAGVLVVFPFFWGPLVLCALCFCLFVLLFIVLIR